MGTIEQLREQWINPSDVSTILMIIGGDVVQNAFAQGTGKFYTPVCFSFGCVAYAFIALVNVLGEGRLLPRPDYPVKVFNLESGYSRENKNWVVGRILRDLEAQISRQRPQDNENGIRISVFEAVENKKGASQFSWGRIHLVGACTTVLQLGIAAIPIAIQREWSIMLITIAGTVLVQAAGLLPQWRAEKLPNRQKSKDIYALTSGNGAQDIVVIIGMGQCLNLEELSATRSPRANRPWEKFSWLSKPLETEKGDQTRRPTQLRTAKVLYNLPLGFRVTQIACSVLSFLWLLFLVNVAAAKDYTWCLLGVGALGMFQNAWLAAVEVPSRNRNLPLHPIDTIKTNKVMDGLMDFDVTYGRGIPLVDEFFPGPLRPEENEWWAGNKEAHDKKRRDELGRGVSRRERFVPPPSPFFMDEESLWNQEPDPERKRVNYEPSFRTRSWAAKFQASLQVQEVPAPRKAFSLDPTRGGNHKRG